MTHANIAVALDEDVLPRLIQLIRDNDTDLAESAMSVPTAHFVSRDRADAEIALMRSLPMVVGHVSEIPDPGAFFTRTLLGLPLLVVRQKDGSVGVFRNMCRHRGGHVEPAATGRKSIFMCQYHGWSYAAEGGALKGVPFEETGGKIDRRCNSLIAFPVEVRHGLIFATLSDVEPKPVAEYLGAEIDGQIGPWRLEESVVFIDETIQLDINWKLVVDGTIDSLHAQFLHPKPGGVGSRTVNHSAVFKEFGRHGKMFMARAKLKKLLDAGEDVSGSSKYIGTVMQIFPNNVFVEAPEHVELWSVWPDVGGPTKCSVRFRFLVRPDILSPELGKRVHKSWDILREAGMEEDFPMEAAIQRNAVAWPEGSYQYGRNEKCAQHLHRQLHKDIDGGQAGPGTVSFF
jgi:nitrite reductase/ring-hydroxylating ferredoxin subunit